MNQKVNKEKPFEYLKRKDGTDFSTETVNNMYVARAYVLDKLKGVAICQGSKEQLRVVITSDSPLMLAVARQVALSAHYANYDEKSPIRTVITIVSRNAQIIEELEKEEYLCNLPSYCMISVNGNAPKNEDSHVDIELRLIEEWNGDDNGMAVVMSEDDVKAFIATKNEADIYSIDTRKAVMANRIYSLGSWIDNLPDEDSHGPERYALALNVFQNNLLRKPTSPMIDPNRWASDLTAVKNGLSSVCCADCFGSRAAGIKRYAKANGMTEKEAWEECIEGLSKSEHARWVAEKLIMGFRPLSEQERLKNECMFGEERRQYRNQLKKSAQDPAHIDICSFADLRRVSPHDMKYDSFLMLAIPGILKKLR